MCDPTSNQPSLHNKTSKCPSGIPELLLILNGQWCSLCLRSALWLLWLMLTVQGVGRLGTLLVVRNRFCKFLGLNPQIIVRTSTCHASLFRFDLFFLTVVYITSHASTPLRADFKQEMVLPRSLFTAVRSCSGLTVGVALKCQFALERTSFTT